MPIFKHHPDGYININGSLIPMDIFLSVAPEYSGIPEGYIGREYVPGERHFLHTSNSSDPQDLEWPEGDDYIARHQEFVDALP